MLLRSDSGAARADPCSSFPMLTMGLLWWLVLSCVCPHLLPRPHSRPFELSPCSPSESPWVLRAEAQVSAPSCSSHQQPGSWVGKCSSMARVVLWVSPPCAAVAQPPHPPLQPLRLQAPDGPPSPWCSLPGWGKISCFTAPSQGRRSPPHSSSSCSLCPVWLYGNLSYSFDWMRCPGSFQWIFCENCPTCRCIFHIYIKVGGGKLHVPYSAIFISFLKPLISGKNYLIFLRILETSKTVHLRNYWKFWKVKFLTYYNGNTALRNSEKLELYPYVN